MGVADADWRVPLEETFPCASAHNVEQTEQMCQHFCVLGHHGEDDDTMPIVTCIDQDFWNHNNNNEQVVALWIFPTCVVVAFL